MQRARPTVKDLTNTAPVPQTNCALRPIMVSSGGSVQVTRVSVAFVVARVVYRIARSVTPSWTQTPNAAQQWLQSNRDTNRLPGPPLVAGSASGGNLVVKTHLPKAPAAPQTDHAGARVSHGVRPTAAATVRD
jgi:hypothetical protein